MITEHVMFMFLHLVILFYEKIYLLCSLTIYHFLYIYLVCFLIKL